MIHSIPNPFRPAPRVPAVRFPWAGVLQEDAEGSLRFRLAPRTGSARTRRARLEAEVRSTDPVAAWAVAAAIVAATLVAALI